ncbi:peptide ligase PGM1-related protein [Leptolyngbya sp. CCNP1308]|uniref:peptide ligase PGM1-related protein n=1 Tax=Leptolyngbya sp. CCNP1308 TaxID=3110255 RepID=UPI002B2124A6|nr:peptide ligase PGM1-related protein [Leptolyngbya sp. CCNP1308]MEA5452687.1 peptide ligase PGM1-related protein [Leptolyngbya sp. CCNP1308]
MVTAKQAAMATEPVRSATTGLEKPAQAEPSFQELQQALRDRWSSTDVFDTEERYIVVVPSLSLDQEELQKIEGVNHYEERLLFSLIRLRNPNTHLVYVTSQPLHPSIVDYYLELLPGIPSSHARDRLTLLSAYDSSRKPLSQKLLERPRLLNRIRKAVNPDRAYMTCYNSTRWERDLSLALGLPLLALDPDLLHWGTKSGSREIFRRCNIPHPIGSELVFDEDSLATVTAEVWEQDPSLQRLVIKLNEGFSGEGNAILDLRKLSDVAPGNAGHGDRVQALTAAFHTLSFQSDIETWEHFSAKIPVLGAIAEAFVEGNHKESPSVQGRITPLGEVEILSTHDQELGGPDGQIFLGCSFPARPDYRLEIQEMGQRIGEELARQGALERYGVDFIAVAKGDPKAPEWDLQAIEINLRKGGTTHPLMAMKMLTEGQFHQTDGLFYTKQEQVRYYRASDNLQKPHYRGLLPSDLIDIIVTKQLHFNSISGVGAAFHLMGCLSEYGKVGLTCIGTSPNHAREIYDQVVDALDESTLG